MLEEYVRLLGQLIPPVDPDVARKVIEGVRRDRPTPKQLYSISAPAGICQGDIIGPVTFKWVGDEGEWVEDRGLGLVLSNSCDAESDDYITVALSFEYQEFAADPAISARADFAIGVANNLVTNLLFLPAVPDAGDLVSDLSTVLTLSRRFLERRLADGTIRRYSAFSDFGYYVFLSKLSLHYLRPEEEVERSMPPKPSRLDRIRAAIRMLTGPGS
jgi:hypothetical protein